MQRPGSRMRLLAVALTLTALLLAMSPASAAPGDISEYAIPTLGSSPQGIAAGPDGALWFTERNGNRIGRITTSGAVTEFALPTADAGATSIVLGPDDALWFTEQGANKIGRITTAGVVTEFAVPTVDSGPTTIALGPDGALWFTEQWGNKIGRITTAGQITEYVVPTSSSWPYGITAGPDGALWFTGWLSSRIGRITTSGEITEFPLAGGSFPAGITTGPDGALWFTGQWANAIGRITTAGAVTLFPIPTADSGPVGIAAGPDGALWFTEQAGNRVARIALDGTITEHVVPTPWSGPYGIAVGPDGNLWFTESSVSAIGRLELTSGEGPPPGEGPVPTDEEPPTITLVSPVDDMVFALDQVVEVAFRCDDTGGSGVESCDGTAAAGSTLDTSTPGVHDLTVTAIDEAGNETSVTYHYLVVSRWGGQLRFPPDVATLRAGQTANLRFDAGGDLGDILSPGYPMSQEVDCDTGDGVTDLQAASSPGPGFRYVGHAYAFSWKTDRDWAGTCRELVLHFAIGQGITLHLTASFA
jgi:virginiamycin B lyase